MKAHLVAFVRGILIGHALIFALLITGCAHLERAYTYHEFDGLFVFYKTRDIATYRELLPKVFDMPDEPMMMVFVMDYYKMDKATEPYKEAAVFLLTRYQKKEGWHCVTMPVTTDDARVKGIQYLGYPKIMGDIHLQREPTPYTGTLMFNNKTVMTVSLDPKNDVSKSEEAWFERFSGLTSYNLLNGRVYEPQFGNRTNILKASRAYPDLLTVKCGTASLKMDSAAAREQSERLAKIFSLRPTEIVLAYYLKNSARQTFGTGKFTQR